MPPIYKYVLILIKLSILRWNDSVYITALTVYYQLII